MVITMQFAVNFFISSSVLIGIIILLRFCFQGMVSYRILYSLWLFAALRLIFPFPVGQTSISVMHSTAYLQKWITTESNHLFSEIKETNDNSQSNQKIDHNAQLNDTNNELQITDTGHQSQRNDISGNPDADIENSQKTDLNSTLQTKTDMELQIGQNPNEEDLTKTTDKNSADFVFSKPAICLLSISLTGSVILFAMIAGANSIFYLKLRQQRTQHAFHFHIKLPVYTAALIKTPCLYGLFHPCIYLPEGFPEKLDEKDMQYVLEHEHMHYYHKDHLWSGLRLLLICLYWLHPIVWCAAILSKKDAELACDEGVLQKKDKEQTLAYAAMLLEVAKASRGANLFCHTAAAHNHKKELKKRMKAITNKKYYKKSHIALFTGLFVVALIATFSGYTEDSQAAVPAKTQTLLDTEKKTVTSVLPKEEIPKIIKKKGGTKGYAIDVANASPLVIFEENETWESMYYNFLSKYKKKWSYYSLVYLGEMDTPVLLTTNYIQKLSSGKNNVNVSGSTCLFAIIGQTVRPIGQINCSSSGEWLHLSDRNLYRDTHHSLTSFGVDNQNGFISTTINDTDSFDSPDSFESQFFRHFDIADSVIFRKNNLKKLSSNNHIFGKKSNYYTQILMGASAYTTGRMVGTNGKKHKIVIRECEAKKENGSNAVKIYSPKNKKKVIWTSDANALIPEKRVKLYTLTKGKRTYIIRYIPEEDEKGNCHYRWEQFYLNEQGEEQIIAQDEIQFQKETMSDKDKESLKQFTKNLWNHRLEKANIMLYAWEYVSLGGNPEQERIYLKGLYNQ